ncbi:MAG: hypothetical protein Q9165_000009 [Trypethelium subeluteriae]
MDPKMDSGCLEVGETLEDDYDVHCELLPEEIIAVMDQILCHEVRGNPSGLLVTMILIFQMAWHQGYPLSQTVLSSVYIDRLLWPDPKTLEDANFDRRSQGPAAKYLLVDTVLRAYCQGVVKCCDHVLRKIISEHYYEEEDFATHTYNRDLLNGFEADDIISALEQARDWMEEQSTIKPSLVKHLIARLDLRIEMLCAFSNDVPDPIIFDRIQSLVKSVRATVDEGKPVKEAFSEKIQRRLASTTPPKPVIEIGTEEAFEKLEQICADLREAQRICKIDWISSPANLRNFLWAFASRKPRPLPFPRALLQSLIFSRRDNDGDGMMHRLMLADLRELTLSEDPLLDPVNWEVEVPSDTRHRIAERIDSFAFRATQDYSDLFRSLCQNRCRIRRTLCHVVQSFEYLQIDAEHIDCDLHALIHQTPIVNLDLSDQPLYQYPLSSWTYHQKLRQMEWIVQLGFEQDIYLPDELAGMYKLIISIFPPIVLSRISTFLKRNQDLAYESRDGDHISQVQRSLDHNTALIEEGAGTFYLSTALGMLYAVLNALYLIPLPPRPFSNAALRYELRMKPFLGLSIPPIIPLEEFQERCQVVLRKPKDFESRLQSIDSAVREAKKQFASLQKRTSEEVRVIGVEESWNKGWVSSCLMACIATGLAVATLQKVQTAHCRSKIVDLTSLVGVNIPGVEERYHEWWIVPRITQVK